MLNEAYMLGMKILERLDALQEMMMGRAAEAPPQEEEGVAGKVQNCRLVATVQPQLSLAADFVFAHSGGKKVGPAECINATHLTMNALKGIYTVFIGNNVQWCKRILANNSLIPWCLDGVNATQQANKARISIGSELIFGVNIVCYAT